jgi:peptidyl-prolyl cis-trans isomerase D
MFTQATKFEMEAADKVLKVAKEMGLKVAAPATIKVDENFGSLGNQRSIVRWAFEDDTKSGAVKRFEVANVGHVIATVKNISGLTQFLKQNLC